MYKINNSIPVFLELVKMRLYNYKKAHYWNMNAWLCNLNIPLSNLLFIPGWKWGDITRAFLIVVARNINFISFNRLGSDIGINQSTCISWTA